MTEIQRSNEKSRLAVVTGSVRSGRFGPQVTFWVVDRVREHGGFEVTVVDAAQAEIPLSLPAVSPKHAGENYPRPEGMHQLTAAPAAAEAFIVVTPEYNHSYPASLKALIDWHFTQWCAKPIALVGYGGASGGRHAMLHLENVFSELHAVTIRERLFFPNCFGNWAEGEPLDPDAVGFAKQLLEQLAWWAEALRTARAAAPYPGV
jgi:NAD(P)H-dependent FMN reductase